MSDPPPRPFCLCLYMAEMQIAQEQAKAALQAKDYKTVEAALCASKRAGKLAVKIIDAMERRLYSPRPAPPVPEPHKPVPLYKNTVFRNCPFCAQATHQARKGIYRYNGQRRQIWHCCHCSRNHKERDS